MDLYAVLCRVIWLSSLALETVNQITVEFSTPRYAPNGIALCFTNHKFPISEQISVTSLHQAGSLYDNWREALTTRRSLQPPAAVRSIETLLSDDPYFGKSILFSKFDRLVNEPTTWFTSQLLSTGAAVDRSASSVEQHTQPLTGRTGACVVLTGSWQPSTAYVLTLNLTIAKGDDPASKTAEIPTIRLLPLTYKESQGNYKRDSIVQTFVRGNKHGQICELRPRAAAALPRMFSACDEALRHQLGPAGAGTTTECMRTLQTALASNASLWVGKFPFNVPPLVNPAHLNASSNPDVSCPPGHALSQRYGGECIDCTNAHLDPSSAKCSCYPGFAANVAGTTACSKPISMEANVSSAAALARQLCGQYQKYSQLMQQGLLADRLVHTMFLQAFQQQAAYLFDIAAVQISAEEFWHSFALDERMPMSPTRRARGVGPNCKSCRRGLFQDIYSKKWVPPADDRFLAVNTFRLIGYLLNSAGSPCPALWDPDAPLSWLYGRHDKTMCLS